MPRDDVAELDAELDASLKACPMFSDKQADFCFRCDLEPVDGFLEPETFNTMAGRCLKTIDEALDELEGAALAPDKLDAKATHIILKIDRIVNNRFRLTDLNRQTADLVISRFRTFEKRLGAKRSKIDVEVGNLYFGLKLYPKAVEWYDLGADANSENKDAWNNKGVALVRMGKTESALQFYDLALKIDSAYEQGWFNKGKAMYKLRRIKEAIACFDRVTQINPESITAWNNKGVLLRLQGRPKEALACYNNAIRLRPDYEWAWHNKGMVLAEQGKNEEALECFEKALTINPSFKPAIDAKMQVQKRGKIRRLFGRKKKEADDKGKGEKTQKPASPQADDEPPQEAPADALDEG